MHTNGSAEKAIKNGSSGIDLKFQDRPLVSLLSLPVGKRSSNYRAEVQALTEASRHLIGMEMEEQNQIIALLTDSLSALQALSGPSDTHTKQLEDNINILAENRNVVLQWIPAHVGTWKRGSRQTCQIR